MARQRFGIVIAAMTCAATVAFCGDAAGAVRLALKLDKGKTYYERSVINQRLTQEMMGQQQVIDSVIGLGQKIDVLDVDDQGNMRIRSTYTWSRLKQAGPMGTVDYDSSQPGAVPAGAEGFAALLGQGYTLRVSPKGEVQDINGVEEMVEAVRQKMPPGADVLVPGTPLALLLDKQAIRENTESSLAVYPDGPVEQGASWSKKRTMKHVLVSITESKWTLQKRQAGVATIVTTTSIQPDPDAAPLDVQGMKIKFDMSGTQEGTIQVNEATGLIQSNRGRSDIKGQIKIGASAEGPFDMTVPMSAEMTFVSEMSDRAWEAPLK